MTYCVEPFIQDLVWCWLDQHAEYTEVAGGWDRVVDEFGSD